MENGENNSGNEVCSTTLSKDSSWYHQFRNASNPWMARYAYALIFLVANLLAWAARDELPSLSDLTELKGKIARLLKGLFGLDSGESKQEKTDFQYTSNQLLMEATICCFGLKKCKVGKDCLGSEGVLRVSLGCFMFYMIMFWSTTRTSKLNNARDAWHSGWWSVKIVLWVAVTIFSFVLPSEFIEIYGEVSHFGAGVFLLVQLISIISFVTWLNDFCASEKYAERCQIHVMLFATTTYFVCLVGIILMYIWYAPQPSCLLNIFFITWTLVLLQLMTSVSLHPKVNAGFLSPGLMGLYVVYLCWSAIRSDFTDFLTAGNLDPFPTKGSEPAGDNCIVKSDSATKTDWQSIISFVVAILAIVIATFSTGIDSKCFQFRKDGTPAEDDVPYGYGFFHFVFATGAMYFAMLLIGWNSHHSMRKWTIDVGWISAWVRIVNEWLAVCVYLWMLVAPIIWKSRHADST